MRPVFTRFFTRTHLSSSTKYWRPSPLASRQQFSSGKLTDSKHGPSSFPRKSGKLPKRKHGQRKNERSQVGDPASYNVKFTNPNKPIDTADDQGSAALKDQFDRYKKFVDSLKSLSSPPNPRRFSETLQFFISFRAATHASKHNMSDVPSQCTNLLLDYLRKQYYIGGNTEWVQAAVMSSNMVPCGTLVAAMQHFLQPFKGTAYSMRVYGQRKIRREETHQKELLNALQESTRIKQLIIRLVEDPACPDIVPVLPMCLSFLELWNSRAWYLGRYAATKLNPDILASAFEGEDHSKQCIDNMLQFINQMENQQQGLPKPDANAYSIYISALAKSGARGSAARAHEVLHYLEGKGLQRNTMYNSTLLAYCNEVKVDPTVIEGAQKLFNHMMSEESSATPDSASTGTLLNAYINARMPGKAEQLLLDFEQNSKTLGTVLSRVEYNIVINSWAKSSDPSGIERAFALFRRMLHLSETGENAETSPDKITYTILIDAFARNPRTGREGLEQAESLLNHAENEEDPRVLPDATMYKKYIAALLVRLWKLRQGHAKAEIASRIETLLNRMREKSKMVPLSEASLWHDASIYNKAIAAWSTTRVPHAIERAEDLYRELVREYKESGFKAPLKPDIETYDAVLTCLGTRQNTGDKQGVGPRAVTLAQNIVKEMEESGLPLTISTINHYLKVLSVSGLPKAIIQAEQTLQSLEEEYAAGCSDAIPNEFSYLYVMDGYAKNGGPEHAERLLNQMISLSRQQEARRSTLSPSVGCYNIVMDAWSRSGRNNAVQNVERVMQRLEARGLQPDLYGYTTLIAAYARGSSEQIAPEKAEAILGKMQSDYQSGKNPSCKPSTASFASVIKCWEKSRKDEAAERIEAIVRRMKELSKHSEYSHLVLNYSCLKFAVLAWLHSTDRFSDAGDRAMGLLDLIDDSLQSGSLEAHYAIHCYNLVIATVARSQDGEKAVKAYNVLDRMQLQGLKPRARDFSAVLSACGQTACIGNVTDLQKQEAFRIANLTFLDYLKSGLKPDRDVYKEMLDLHSALMLDDDTEETREKIVAIFSDAPQTIQQAGVIREALRAALPIAVYEELIAKADLFYERGK